MDEGVQQDPGDRKQRGRRQEYAEATRQAILLEGRRLFAEQGYFATRVEDIAAAARVAPATVYAVVGGKQGLLQTLVEQWMTDPSIPVTDANVMALQDPAAIIRLVSERCREMRESHGETLRTILSIAPNDPVAGQVFRQALGTYRSALGRISRRLVGLGGLRDGLGPGKVADILWFYFGTGGIHVMCDECGWSPAEAEKWLADQAIQALLCS